MLAVAKGALNLRSVPLRGMSTVLHMDKCCRAPASLTRRALRPRLPRMPTSRMCSRGCPRTRPAALTNYCRIAGNQAPSEAQPRPPAAVNMGSPRAYVDHSLAASVRAHERVINPSQGPHTQRTLGGVVTCETAVTATARQGCLSARQGTR